MHESSPPGAYRRDPGDALQQAFREDAIRALRTALPLAIACLLVEAGGHLLLDASDRPLQMIALPLALLAPAIMLLHAVRRTPERLPGPVWWLLAPWAIGMSLALTHDASLTLVLVQAGLLMLLSALTSDLRVWLVGVTLNATSLGFDAWILAGSWGPTSALFFVAMGAVVFWTRRQTVIDATERLRLQRELQTRHHEAERLHRLETLTAGFSHHFNNHLTTVLGSLDLARQGLPPGHMALRDLESADQATREAAQLIRSIRAATDLDRDQPDSAHATIDVSALVDPETLRELVPEELRLQVSVDADLPRVSVDVAGLQGALRHLIDNAVEACRDGAGNQIELNLSGERSPQGTTLLRIDVVDDGPGYPDAVASRLTEPFFTTREPTRAGLGLAITLAVAKREAGDLEHRRENGRTRFTLRLPLEAPGV